MPTRPSVGKCSVCIVIVLHLVSAATRYARAADASFPSNEDLRHIRAMADPRISPDGRRVLIQITEATADGGRSHLWLVDVTLNTARQLTWSPMSDTLGERSGRWLGSGDSILFLANRAERAQLFRLPMSGGEARAYDLRVVSVIDSSSDPDAAPPKQVDDPVAERDSLPLEVEDYEAAPDGRAIAILAVDPETPGERKKKADKADAVRLDHDLHGKRLYLLNPESGNLTPVAIPPDVSSIRWARQSDRLIALTEGPNHAADLGPATSAWLVQVADPGHPSQLKECPATIQDGSFSDDGMRFYFRAQAAGDTPPYYPDLYVMDLAKGAIRNLTVGLGGSVQYERPISLGDEVIQAVQLGTRTTYFRIHGDKVEAIRFQVPVVSDLDGRSTHGGWVWLGQSGAQPTTLYYAKQLGGAAKVLQTPDLLPARWPPATSRIVRWSNDGLSLEGLLYLPPQSAGHEVPLIIDVHSGPTGAWQDSFDPLIEFLLGHGWAVLRPNPRGSTGYGAAFAAAIKNDLGGGDYRDIMAGLDAVIAQYAVDSKKLALMGYSYGGEMAAFVEGKTDRFKAIVSGAPVIDQQSEYGTEGSSWYDRWFYGRPWEHAEAAWRQSPLAQVAHAKTPFLLIQGESDRFNPLGQSLEMYRALRQAGVPVEMVKYPREDHLPLLEAMTGAPSLEPWHGFDVRQRIATFFTAAFAEVGAGK